MGGSPSTTTHCHTYMPAMLQMADSPVRHFSIQLHILHVCFVRQAPHTLPSWTVQHIKPSDPIDLIPDFPKESVVLSFGSPWHACLTRAPFARSARISVPQVRTSYATGRIVWVAVKG